jgi:GDP-L-fucose synthase
MREEALLSGPLEPTNQWYAVAKIAGIKLCQAYRKEFGRDFISVMPTNLYGPNDNFDLASSHVLPALIRKFHEATLRGLPEVRVWGTGRPKREFLHANDLADACVFLMRNYSGDIPLNIGTGSDLSIAELADMIRRVTGFEGAVTFDETQPDGVQRKLLDTSRLQALGWSAGIALEDGVRQTYSWYLEHHAKALGAQ